MIEWGGGGIGVAGDGVGCVCVCGGGGVGGSSGEWSGISLNGGGSQRSGIKWGGRQWVWELEWNRLSNRTVCALLDLLTR